MGAKHEKIVSDTLFYCFVDFGLKLTNVPTCFVLPSAIVADVLTQSYHKWLSTPGAKGQQRRETDLRRFLPNYDKTGVIVERGEGWLEPYRVNWALIEGSARAS